LTTFNTITALKTGDRVVFEVVFHDHYERVYFYLLGKTKARYISEEGTQLAFIKLWQYRSSLDENIALNIQLFRIVRTTLIDLLRKEQIKNAHAAGAATRRPLHSNQVWEDMMAQEMKTRLSNCMQAMPAVRKRVFEMSRIREMSNKEIASELSISVKAVEFHISKAIRYLRHILPVLFFISGTT
jgi:RNA polymerase sigma-70 factor (ECF subfamily)